MIIPVILCGGSSKRLLPLTENTPKQFLKIADGTTLFSRTYKRITEQDIFSEPVIITSASQEKFLEKENIPKEIKIIFEPETKNTFGAIVAASYACSKIDANAKICIFPSDHLIKDFGHFSETIKQAEKYADDNVIVFGIRPKYAATEYGYILRDRNIENGLFKVKKFIEKPDQQKAEEYFNSGKYYFNSGIFLSSSKFILDICEKLESGIFDNILESFAKARQNGGNTYLAENYRDIGNVPFDIAVLERISEIIMAGFENDIGWADLGSFKSLKENDIEFIRGDNG